MCHALFHLLSAFIPTALVFLGITLFVALTSLTSSSYKTPPPEAEGCQCLWAFSIFSLDAVFHHLDSGRLEPLHVVGPPFPHVLVLPFSSHALYHTRHAIPLVCISDTHNAHHAQTASRQHSHALRRARPVWCRPLTR